MRTEPSSYWQRTSTEIALSTSVPQMVDVAVIGGGLLGSAVGYWLARAGVQVALFERDAIGIGATGRNGGFVAAGPAGGYRYAVEHLGHTTARAVMHITIESKMLVRQIVAEEGIDCHYREPGLLRLALNETQAMRLQQEGDLMLADGFPVSLLDRAQTQELIKTPLATDIMVARFSPGQGLVHSARFVRGLAGAAIRRGAHAYQAEVTALREEGDHVLLHTAQGMIRAGMVVVAVNAWTGKLLPALADVIAPEREQMLAYAPLPAIFASAITVDMEAGEYMQQTPDGNILIGGCNTVAPDGDLGIWEGVPTSIVQDAIEQVVPRLFPSLAPLQVIQRWAGLLDCTTDRHPIADYAPDMSRVLFTAGFSGHGMPFGMRFGQLLSTAVQTGVVPDLLKPFRLDRPTLKRWRLA